MCCQAAAQFADDAECSTVGWLWQSKITARSQIRDRCAATRPGPAVP